MTLSNTTTTPMGTDWFVRKTTETDLPAITDTLSEAFYDDPVFRWWIPEDDRRAAILPPFFRLLAEAHLPLDELYATDEVNGCAVWVPPGMQPTAEEMAELAPRFAEVSEEYAERLFYLLARMEEVHPTEPHWYLFVLGTKPEWQGRGMGSALLRKVLKECDRDGIPAYLEASSERNRDLYLRHGFEVVCEITVEDGPTGFSMWRTPRSRPNP